MHGICRLISVVAVSLAFAATAHAQGSRWYAAVGGGASFTNDVDVSASGLSASAEVDTGFLVTGAFGAFIDKFRVEGEINYTQADLDSTPILGSTVPLGGDMSTTSFMVNGYYEFDTSSKWFPYVGGGIGVANVSLSDISSQGVVLADDDAAAFAYQLKLGVAYRFTSSVDGTLGYRFFGTDDTDYNAVDGTPFTLDGLGSHNFEVGVRFRF